ncbi:SDR family oxidoreductase [Nocardia sp. NPDC058658]|uniref:SDR family oxidoreductase n=1 Tax=Nocardia sp. NPDC058658 TaxID=3346580 RepID=UPI00364F3789
MKVAEKVAIVTGGGAGIGAALAAALAAAGAKVVVSDLDAAAALAVSEQINAAHPGSTVGVGADAADTAAITGLIALAQRHFGPVDLYFANAGIVGAPGLDVTEDDWDRSLEVNLRAHIRAAKLLVPQWVERGAGYFISTASAAGLLTQIGSATYSVSKHAAVGFAEWLSVTYGDNGIRVSCLCPMGVNTKLLYAGRDSGDELGAAATRAVVSAGDVLEPGEVAEIVLAAVDAEQFLILPHPQVLDMYRNKGTDYDRWLRGMRRYQSSLLTETH